MGSKKHPTFCKVRGADLKSLEPKLLRLLKKPKYVCRRCLRVAKKKDLLCKPEKL